MTTPITTPMIVPALESARVSSKVFWVTWPDLVLPSQMSPGCMTSPPHFTTESVMPKPAPTTIKTPNTMSTADQMIRCTFNPLPPPTTP